MIDLDLKYRHIEYTIDIHYDPPRMIKPTNVIKNGPNLAWVSYDNNIIIVIFREIDNIWNMMQNINIFYKSVDPFNLDGCNSDMKLYSGFFDAFYQYLDNSIWDKVKELTKNNKPKNILFVGHSLGWCFI